MGFAKGGADVALAEAGPEETLLNYNVKAQVGGKIAQLGARLVDSTAKQMADQFFDRFSAHFPPPETEAAAQPEAAMPVGAVANGGNGVAQPQAGTDTEYLAHGAAPGPLTQHGAEGPSASGRPGPPAQSAPGGHGGAAPAAAARRDAALRLPDTVLDRRRRHGCHRGADVPVTSGPDIGRRHAPVAGGWRLRGRPGARHHRASRASHGQAALPGRGAWHRQDGDRQGACGAIAAPLGAPPMLRRARPFGRRL